MLSAEIIDSVGSEPWIQTRNGAQFNFLNPAAGDIAIEDIAWALSQICRFVGHTRTHYSVAEHSVRVARICPPEYRMHGLLHDASEAFTGDLASPLKRMSELAGFRAVEYRAEEAVAKRFGLQSVTSPPAVKFADLTLLATEARDLLRPRHADFVLPFDPLPGRIRPWSARKARRLFLRMFYSLSGETRPSLWARLAPRLHSTLR